MIAIVVKQTGSKKKTVYKSEIDTCNLDFDINVRFSITKLSGEAIVVRLMKPRGSKFVLIGQATIFVDEVCREQE